jgi:hypothetical protein
MKKSTQNPESVAESASKPNHKRGWAHVTHQMEANQKRFAMINIQYHFTGGLTPPRSCAMTSPHRIGTANANGATFSGGRAI